MSPITLAEKHYNFSEEQLTAARQAKILSPHTDYQDILHTIQTKKGISFEDRPEHLLAELVNIQENKKESQEFYDKYQNDELSGGVSKNQIDRLLRKLRNTYENSKSLDFAREASSNNIFSENLEKYYDVRDNGPKETQFINHSTGERVKVDNEKLTQDPQYFTKIVAQLAKSEIDNILYKQESKNIDEEVLIHGMMRSREFRKFYYFVRRFLNDKINYHRVIGGLEIDNDENVVFYYDDLAQDPFGGIDVSQEKYRKRDDEDEDSYSKRFEDLMAGEIIDEFVKHKANYQQENSQISEEEKADSINIPLEENNFESESGEKDGKVRENGGEKIENLLSYPYYNIKDFNEEEQINNIFQPPQFDISNFREYYPEHEYETMIKDFDEYTKGNTPLSKKNFVKRKLLGHKIKIDAKQKIKENLKDLFKTRTDDELQTDRPSELIGHYIPETLAPLSSHFKKEIYYRRLFEYLHKDELKREWLEYKQNKINKYLKKNSEEAPLNLSLPLNLDISDDKNLEESIGQIAAIDDVSNLIDIIEDNGEPDLNISKDHLAFEFLDIYTNALDFQTPYEDQLHGEVYGEDYYDQYQDDEEIIENFKDLFEQSDPYNAPEFDNNIFAEVNEEGRISKKNNQKAPNEKNLKLAPEQRVEKDFEYLGSNLTTTKDKLDVKI